jgi:DNA topoisomerase-1
MLTDNLVRNDKGWLVKVNNAKPNEVLAKLRIPPAWTDVKVDPDNGVTVLATGKDAAGRLQRLYSPQHIADSKAGKFEKVRALLSEWEDIRIQLEADINDRHASPLLKEAAMVAYLIYNTGIRPGSNTDTLAAVKAYGATTLQLRHIKPVVKGLRLKFVGKKGVKQSVLVTNPYLVRIMVKRKYDSPAWTKPIFKVSHSTLCTYFKTLGSGIYTPKDLRTGIGTKRAIELLGNRKRLPKAKSRRKKVMNNALDKVARKLGNTRSVSRSAYVDPVILERFIT